METTEKYARRCDATGKGMNLGFCFFDGDKYFSNRIEAEKYAIEYGFETLEEAYNSGSQYFTEWEVEEGENYFDAAGNEYDEEGELIEDLFANQEFLPSEVKQVIEKWEEKHFDFTYEECAQFIDELEQVGYTCDYGLDAIPINLKKL